MALMQKQKTVLKKRAKLMFSSLSADLRPLLEWLYRINVVDSRELKVYSDEPHTFFKHLRNGYILSKLGIVAIQIKSTVYGNYVSSSAQTRYIL